MTDSPQPGDDCAECADGHLIVYSSHPSGPVYVRYLRCAKCKKSPPRNQMIVNADTIAKRTRGRRRTNSTVSDSNVLPNIAAT